MLTLILSPTFTNHITRTGSNIPLRKQEYHLNFQLNVDKGRKLEQIVKLSSNRSVTPNNKLWDKIFHNLRAEINFKPKL